VGRFFFSAWMALAISLVVGLVIATSHLTVDLWSWRSFLLSALWFLLSGLSFWKLRAGQSRCWLSWDGNFWHIQTLLPEQQSEAALQTRYAVNVHLDLQGLLFISLRCEKGLRQWFWLSQNSFPDRWHVFRCAVYSRSEELSS
jgi:hypothetical protein